jgi:two-component system, OmpR family, KDP operon response regulator KdpE
MRILKVHTLPLTVKGNSMGEKLLILDDDVALSELLAARLEGQGYATLVAHNGRDGMRIAYEAQPDLIILDISMPEMDGFEVCRRLREMTDVPILMLTARTGNEDLVRGFEAGADDYVKKPVDFSELELRIRAILKRAGGEKEALHFDDGNLQVDLERGHVYLRGERVHLSPTEQRLLSCLVRERGRVVYHAELLKQVWGEGYLDSTANLSLYIRYLREKLEDDPSEPRYICNEWGVGYWFAPSGPGCPAEDVHSREN